MPVIEYQTFRFRTETLKLIDYINEIIGEYDEQGYSLTLRQVYYQLVARDLIPNNDKQYKIIGNAVNDARLVGLIDWYAIEDRTRYLRSKSHWNNPADIIRSAMNSYHKDHWEDQEGYLEVWVEKDALIGIVEVSARKFDVPCFSCRGYTSQSEMWRASQRFIEKQQQGKFNIIIHLGDHDPSGIDMTRDIKERLKYFGANVQVERIALNRDQISEYNPPPNPAKLTDSRCQSYIKKFGSKSWELDALRPELLAKLIEEEIELYIDLDKFYAVQDKIEKERKQLLKLSNNWQKVCSYSFMKEGA